MIAFLVIIAAMLRVFGSFHDGISNRPEKIGWIFWHGVNWVRRDLIIAAIVWKIHGAPWDSFDAITWWIIWVGLNAGAHKLCYWAGEQFSFWLLTHNKY